MEIIPAYKKIEVMIIPIFATDPESLDFVKHATVPIESS
jgi:hypothetical protein